MVVKLNDNNTNSIEVGMDKNKVYAFKSVSGDVYVLGEDLDGTHCFRRVLEPHIHCSRRQSMFECIQTELSTSHGVLRFEDKKEFTDWCLPKLNKRNIA